MDTQQNLEQRVARLEELLDKIIAVAEQHPMGRAILYLSGIRE